MENISKFVDRFLLRKWIVYGIVAIFVYAVLREFFFLSIFNSVMSSVKAQNAEIEKRQAAIMEKAKQMQNRMDAKLNQFQASMQSQTSKMKSSVDDFDKGAVQAENAFANNRNQADLTQIINDQIMDDRIDQSIEDRIRNDAKEFHDYSPQYFEVTPDEQQILEKLIAAYKAAHPNFMQTSGTSKPQPIKLTPQDQIVLMEMIRAYNKRLADKAQQERDAQDAKTYGGASVESFEKSRQKFDKAFQDGIDEWKKNDQEMDKELP